MVLLVAAVGEGPQRRRGLRVSIATDDPYEPVVVEGTAEIVTDRAALRGFLDAMNTKYATAYGEDFLDPAGNASMRLRPEKAFGLREKDFPGTPTRWTFP